MIPLEEARAHVLGRCSPLPPVRLPLSDVLGCATAEPLTSPEDVPPFANTAVDGYAVRSADTSAPPVVLRVAGTIPAGAPPDVPVDQGTAVRVMTGAPLPPGADAVVMVEDTEALDDGSQVRIGVTVPPRASIRPAGDDVREGQLLFPAFTELRPAHVGVLASVGLTLVPVFPRARVGVLSTGDELVEGGGPLHPGQIRESNRGMLLGLVAEAGATPVDLGLVGDDKDAMTEVITKAVASCDAVVTSGGVSMGDFDLIKVVLDELGDMRWMQIAIKPAKPFSFGVIRDDRRLVPVFGLPGNPVSSLVSFELLARPALRQLMGHVGLDRPEVVAISDEALRRRPDGKVHFQRVHARFLDDGRVHVKVTGPQGSHQLAATAAANALAIVPEGDGVPAGGAVTVLLLT